MKPLRSCDPVGSLALLIIGIACLALVGCSSDSEPSAAAGIDSLDVQYVRGSDVYSTGDGEPGDAADSQAVPPLGAVDDQGSITVFYADRVAVVDPESPTTQTVLEFDPPVFGVEIAPSADGHAIAAVTLPIGDLPSKTRVLWVSGGTETLLEADLNLSVAGVITEGIVVRDVDSGVVSVLDWSGSMAGLGLQARDAMVVPTTPLLLSAALDGSPRFFDISAGDEVQIEGIEALEQVVQLAASPAQPQIALAATTPSGSTALFVVDGTDRTLRRLIDLDRLDIVAGFSAAGDAVALVTDGERFGSEVVLVALEDAAVTAIDLPADATPLSWSRTVLTLQSLRFDPEAD